MGLNQKSMEKVRRRRLLFLGASRIALCLWSRERSYVRLCSPGAGFMLTFEFRGFEGLGGRCFGRGLVLPVASLGLPFSPFGVLLFLVPTCQSCAVIVNDTHIYVCMKTSLFVGLDHLAWPPKHGVGLPMRWRGGF